MVEIAPSILSADFARLGEEIAAAERGGASIVHVDVMDGHFVPNITVGIPVLRSLARATRLPIDAHLMISEPGIYAEQFAEAGARMVSVHVEADAHIHRTLAAVRRAGAQAGVVINPATPAAVLEEILPDVSLVLVMTVNPGFGGQAYIATMEPKIREAATLIEASGLPIDLEVDGGISPKTIAGAAAAGARVLVAGSALYKHEGGLTDAVTTLRRLAEEALAA